MTPSTEQCSIILSAILVVTVSSSMARYSACELDIVHFLNDRVCTSYLTSVIVV